jgi:hypothetical protein
MCFSRMNAPSVPAALRRSASASSARFSLPENWRRRPIANTSGSEPDAPEAASPVALRPPSVTASEEEPVDPFKELFGNEIMCMSYLYTLDEVVPYHWHERWGDYLALHPELAQLPVQHVSGRPGLVANPQLLRLSELAHEATDGLGPVRYHAKTAHFTACLCHRHGNRLRMDIQANKSYVLHRRLPFVCGSAPRFFPDPQRNPRAANREPVVPL